MLINGYDTRSDAQKARAKRDKEICDDYRNCVAVILRGYDELKGSGFSAHCLMQAVAKRKKMTVAGVRKVLIRNGVYQDKNKQY